MLLHPLTYCSSWPFCAKTLMSVALCSPGFLLFMKEGHFLVFSLLLFFLSDVPFCILPYPSLHFLLDPSFYFLFHSIFLLPGPSSGILCTRASCGILRGSLLGFPSGLAASLKKMRLTSRKFQTECNTGHCCKVTLFAFVIRSKKFLTVTPRHCNWECSVLFYFPIPSPIQIIHSSMAVTIRLIKTLPIVNSYALLPLLEHSSSKKKKHEHPIHI